MSWLSLKLFILCTQTLDGGHVVRDVYLIRPADVGLSTDLGDVPKGGAFAFKGAECVSEEFPF